MSETCYQSSKAKGNRFGRLPKLSTEVRPRFLESSNGTPLPFTPVITWLTKPMSVLLPGALAAEHTSDSRMTEFANMSGAESGMVGHQNSLPVASRNYTLNYPSAMKPFTNGSMPMPESLYRHWSDLTKTASDEVIRGVIKRPIFRREYRLKSVLNMFNHAKSLAIGRPIRLSRAKAGLHCKSALSEQPGSLNLPNCLGKEHAP